MSETAGEGQAASPAGLKKQWKAEIRPDSKDS